MRQVDNAVTVRTTEQLLNLHVVSVSNTNINRTQSSIQWKYHMQNFAVEEETARLC